MLCVPVGYTWRLHQPDGDAKGHWVCFHSSQPRAVQVWCCKIWCGMVCLMCCSWKLHQQDGRWAMRLSAIRGIAEGEELLLSYGERSNDHFFLYYGFVPAKNPHDEAVMFGNLEEALEWHHEHFQEQHQVNSCIGIKCILLAVAMCQKLLYSLRGLRSGTNELPGASPGALVLTVQRGQGVFAKSC